MNNERISLDVGADKLGVTLHLIGIYPGDPTHRWLGADRDHGFAKAVLSPEGPGTACFRWDGSGSVEVDLWGDSIEWLAERAPEWLGLHDDLTGFDPTIDRRVNDLWRRLGPFRMSRFGTVWQELLLVIIGQRVTTQDALRSWSALCSRWGSAAPGPYDLQIPPRPEQLAELHYTDLHEIGIERRRADVLLRAARRAHRLEEAAGMPTAEAVKRLSALPGLGPWTVTATMAITHGDPDVVMLGDYGMPTLVNYFFTGESARLPPEPDGDRVMLEHLSPWSGHRQRVMKLLLASGIQAPRRAPRARNPDIRRM